MKLSELFTDDDAVSPVIGVILMVAITVILAAVIGAFVLNIGGSQESAPQVTWDWSDDPTNGDVALKHNGGDKVNNPEQITLSNSGSTSLVNTNLADYSEFSSTASAGDSADVLTGATGDSGTIELIWESSDGSDSQILSSHDYDFT